MSTVVHAVLFAGALIAGSWFGLGRPSLEDGRGLMAKVRAAADPRPFAGASAPANGRANDDRALEFGPLPQLRAPGDNPAMRPWPELNAGASIAKAWMVAEGPEHRPDDNRRVVTLTFDDGPFPETTPAVLRTLAKYNVRAVFFVIGRYLDGEGPRACASRESLKEVVAAGHLVGNHTHDHALLTNVTHTQVLEQIDQGAASIERVTGHRPVLFRPPFGQLDDFGQAAVRERGLDLMLWSIEKQDMQRTDSHRLFRELVSQIKYKGGGVILLHDIRWTSIFALRELLAWLDEHRWDPARPGRVGYEIVDLPTYLREVAAAPLPYASRDELERARALGPTRAGSPTVRTARR